MPQFMWYGICVPRPGPPAVEVESPNHWNPRKSQSVHVNLILRAGRKTLEGERKFSSSLTVSSLCQKGRDILSPRIGS